MGRAAGKNDLTDQRFGRLVAVECTNEKRNQSYLWRCRCDCGGEILVESRKLSAGTVRSCGCLRAPRYKDLTGQRFGMLTAIEKIPDANAGQAVWRCRCDCGRECEVKKLQLERGSVRDCGCVRQTAEPDLTGQRFGNLTVTKRLAEKSYLCLCDCGNEKEAPSSSLLSGKLTSCGCMRGRRKRQDIAGMRSGMVTAISPTQIVRRSNILWRCRCDCGKEFLTEGYRISSGKIQSCGCLRDQHKVKDLTGQRFGKLVAVKRLDEKIGSSYAWLCDCDCGNQTKVATHALLSGGTQSCGCTIRENALERVNNGYAITDYCHFVDGTCVERVESAKKLRADNTSGYTGVYSVRGKWRAAITFKQKTYYLGAFSSIEAAIRARKQAEARIFDEFLEWYYQEHPKEPPAVSEQKDRHGSNAENKV